MPDDAPPPNALAPAAEFLGIPLNAPTLDELCRDVLTLSRDASRTHLVTYINAHCANLFHKCPEYADVLRGADYIYADGMSVVKAARRFGVAVPERLSAAHFFDRFCECCAAEGRTLYFLGSKRPQVRGAAERLMQQIPGLKVVGWSTGHFELGYPEEEQILAKIRACQPDILVVGMGAPRQEIWAERHREALGVPVVWCVGAMFEYFSGARGRAPKWMRDRGLEWVMRLLLEPRRMWRRYLIGNVEFMLRVRRALKKVSSEQ